MDRDRRDIQLIIGALFLGASPHFGRLPLWATCWCTGFWALSLVGAGRGWKKPGRFAASMMVLSGFAGVLLTFGFPFARDAGVCLLCLTASLKPMETRTFRDRMVAVFLSYFLVLTTLLFSTSLLITLHMLLSVLLITGVLIAINRPQAGAASSLRLSLTLMLQALPFTLVLFFLFPRIQGSLWGVKSPGTALTGLSETLSFGSITRLATDRRVAFRVEFKGRIPEPEYRYFRAIVFKDCGGSGWTRGKWTPPLLLPRSSGRRAEYEITLEPHGKEWLPALDLPLSAPPGTVMKGDFTLNSKSALKKRHRYPLVSATRYNTGDHPPDKRYLRIPEAGNLRARALARKWAAGSKVPRRIVETALVFFRTGDFYYTLTPPPIAENSVDEFIFEKKRGYCGHYAASFAFLMRAAGIPARIAGGYLGGELNPFGNYLIVRQSEAHAWVEVWLEKSGWRRIDPTSVVAPLRVTEGLEAALPPADRGKFSLFLEEGIIGRSMKGIFLGWDAVNLGWNRWVIGYSFIRQNTLLGKFGIKAASRAGRVKILLLFLMGLSPFALLIPLIIHHRKKQRQAPEKTIFNEFCLKLAGIDLPRKPSQGPVSYAAMVAARRPDLAPRVEEITKIYVQMRYGRRGIRKNELKKLRSMVKKFNAGSSPGSRQGKRT